MLLTRVIGDCAIHIHTSRVWKQTASKHARAMCALLVNCVRPQIVLQKAPTQRQTHLTHHTIMKSKIIWSVAYTVQDSGTQKNCVHLNAQQCKWNSCPIYDDNRKTGLLRCSSKWLLSTSLGNSGLCWTVFARNKDTAVPAEGNGDLHWSVSLWRDPNDVSHCRILSPDKTEWRLISCTLCGWRRCFVADKLWFTTRIWEEEEPSDTLVNKQWMPFKNDKIWHCMSH